MCVEREELERWSEVALSADGKPERGSWTNATSLRTYLTRYNTNLLSLLNSASGRKAGFYRDLPPSCWNEIPVCSNVLEF